MAVYNYLDLYDRIEAVVYDNTTKEIKAEKVKQLLKDIIDSQVYLIYSEDRSYEVNAFCYYDDGGGWKAYTCIAPTNGVFAPGDWSQIGV